nr:VCBS repeat-containing protein [Saprospiraceae bacterium]
LDFENVLKPTSEFNVFNYMYFFNGGGLAAGDFNKDGLVDLYFTSNMGPNKLFLNEGGLKFRDVTDQAGLAGMDGWTTGASVVDINNDGLLDIYVSQMGDFQNIRGQNQLYICTGIENGVPVFEDQAVQYNLDLVGFSTQAVFFDYDLDGDLDMYQLNHSLHANGTFGQKKEFVNTVHPMAGDKLMRNDGDTFTNVTVAAGINSTVIGYGLGVVTGDINLDGWPDIYIGNDFHENDYLYINQKDGTFKEMLPEEMMHTSRFSMGVDMADINNDAFNEVISLDMLPSDPFILKTSLGEDDYALFHFKVGYGYNHQYARNNLQLNNGDGTFSEIGIFSGVFATDWSWAPLFLDFDHDGYKDLFISNGIPRRMNDIDYVNFRADNAIRYKANTNNLENSDLVV